MSLHKHLISPLIGSITERLRRRLGARFDGLGVLINQSSTSPSCASDNGLLPEADARPVVVPRPEHTISRANISPNALKVLYRLHQAGFRALLVGGGVRDLLLGHTPKDFDIATDATPEQVRQVFRNCRLIGRRFRLAHVHFGREIIEVATFRGQGDTRADGHTLHDSGRILHDNIYGSIEEDALRRDFTINALYYDIADFSLLDYVGGLADLRAGQIRLIGEPERRYREDPVRMLRVVRFAAKLRLAVEPRTEAPLFELGHLLGDVPAARLFDETLKLLLSGYGAEAFEQLCRYRLFGELFPATAACLADDTAGVAGRLIHAGLAGTDARIAADKPVTPAFLLAVLLWAPLRQQVCALQAQGVAVQDAVAQAASEVTASQRQLVSLPKRFSLPMREIWALQWRLERRREQRTGRLLHHPRFRAAYDFLLLRAQVGEVDQQLADCWTRYQESSPQERVDSSATEPPARRRRRRRRKPKSSAAVGEQPTGVSE